MRVVEAEFCALVTGQITPPGVDGETVKMVSQAARNAVTTFRGCWIRRPANMKCLELKERSAHCAVAIIRARGNNIRNDPLPFPAWLSIEVIEGSLRQQRSKQADDLRGCSDTHFAEIFVHPPLQAINCARAVYSDLYFMIKIIFVIILRVVFVLWMCSYCA